MLALMKRGAWFWLESVQMLIEEIDLASKPPRPEPGGDFRFARLMSFF